MLRGVSFAYGPHAEPVLRDLDLVVPIGDRDSQELQLVVRSPEGPAVLRSVPCRFVPLVGSGGFERE